MREVYKTSYFALAENDLVSMAKAKISVSFMRDFNARFEGDEETREDAMVLSLARLPGLEPFGLTVLRLPGATHQMAKDQQTKLRAAARRLLSSFKP